MSRVLLTGMSGTGKSTVIGELRRMGFTAIDMDEPGWSVRDADGHQRWCEGRLREALAAERAGPVFVCGCAENQVAFYPQFRHIVLMSAPADVIRERLASRTDNPYGKRPEELAEVLHHLEWVEPLLRQSATHEIVTTMPLDRVVAAILSLACVGLNERRSCPVEILASEGLVIAWRCDVEFHVLGPDDLAAMHAMLSLFGRAFGDGDTYDASRPDAGYLARLLGSPGFVAVVARQDGCVVGGLAAYVLHKFEQPRSEVYIYDLAVDEPVRRRGVATGLIEKVRAVAADRGAWVVYVQADRGDAPAVALYSKLGVGEDVLHFDFPPLRVGAADADGGGTIGFPGPQRQ